MKDAPVCECGKKMQVRGVGATSYESEVCGKGYTERTDVTVTAFQCPDPECAKWETDWEED